MMTYRRHGEALSIGLAAGTQTHFVEKTRFYVLLACSASILSLTLLLSGCASPAQTGAYQQTPVLEYARADDAQAILAQEKRLVNVEVTVTATVKKLLRDDTRGRPHQKFLILLSNGTTVLVAHNTEEAPRVPISEGDIVRIHGEYIWNAKGGLIHWTHHSESPRHEGGWIEFNGQRYE